jgi:hypothetical protein
LKLLQQQLLRQQLRFRLLQLQLRKSNQELIYLYNPSRK